MKDFIKKEVAFERVIFFSDAIVAIAITLLALNLKLDLPLDHPVSFSDLLLPWRNYLAFILSFINIAGFWRTHHNAFVYIFKMDDRMMFFKYLLAVPDSHIALCNNIGECSFYRKTGDLSL